MCGWRGQWGVGGVADHVFREVAQVVCVCGGGGEGGGGEVADHVLREVAQVWLWLSLWGAMTLTLWGAMSLTLWDW